MTTDSIDSQWLASVKRLIDDLASASVDEFRLENGNVRIFIRRNGHNLSSAPRTNGKVDSVRPSADGLQICAPLAGIFYLTPSPAAQPFVKIGDLVEAGQVVGLVEAMKAFNEIRAEHAGRVSRVSVASGQLVQKGQVLIEMDKE